MYEKYLALLEEAGKIRNLKERSINCYKNYVSYFLKYQAKRPEELTCQDVRTFLLAKKEEGLKATTLNLYNSAIRFFYRNVLHILWDDITVPRMILEHNLPTVLTVDEIDRLLEAVDDIKYKAMFATMYSSGMRVSEVIHLHYDDISRSNMQIHVRDTKNRMDRYTILSKRCLDILTQYWFEKGRPRGILFPNKFTGNYLTVSTLEQVMRRAVSAAELPKKATPHCLRHSFATHLMEQGVERQNIQALLGHRDPKSTEVYLHVSNKSRVRLTGKKALIMNKPTVQDIFLHFYPAYLEKHSPSAEQAKVSRNIMNCKTGAYGANVSVCEDCGAVQIHYNSCRNRCCPMCQAVPKEMWMDARREDVLDAPYFHLVFTVPDILNPIIYNNQKLLYDTLYHAASATIGELVADPEHLGANVGYICILHTWGSEMNFHPHIHTILLGGGLTSQNKWKDNGTEFFLPIWAISKVFRGKYMEELKKLWNANQLEFHGTAEKYRNHYAFKELIDSCYDAEWIPYCKKTFNGAQSVIDYLGKYTHRIAISNHRIIRMNDETVTFYVKDYRNKGQWKELTLSGVEFIRRFLMHVPPKRFVRIRHYGLLCSRSKHKKLTLCRNLLGCQKYLSKLRGKEMPEILKQLYEINICVCKSCGGHLGKPQLRIPQRC